MYDFPGGAATVDRGDTVLWKGFVFPESHLEI